VWEKAIGANPLLCKKMPMKYHENILVFYKKQPKYNPQMTKGKMRDKKPKMYGNKQDENWGGAMREVKGIENVNDDYYPRSYQYFSNADQKRKMHPTQKPVALFEYLIKTYTNEGDLVLDNCAGSFTTAIASENLKRNWICIEREAEYCEIGRKRIEENRERLRMLDNCAKLDI